FLARIAAQYGPLRSDVPFYVIKMYDQTLPYYLRRTVIQVEHPDEMAMGLVSEPQKAIDTVDDWKRRWNDDVQAYAMMTPEDQRQLEQEGVPMRELARDPRRVIVARH